MTWNYAIACFLVFLVTYTLNLLYVSVFYHRAFTHSSLTLTPWLEKFVIHSGNWVTGIDPKGWACMHRLHHKYSDTEKDPHSPVPKGVWSVAKAQLVGYQRALTGLSVNRPYYSDMVRDLKFPVSWLNQRGLWVLPYLLQLGIAIAIGVVFHAWLLAACYWLGMMSHPVQGWMVNALAHRFGYRNFETPDNSRNNTIVSWLVFGEGLQNNHHHSPTSPRFSYTKTEVDLGYALCRGLCFFRLAKLGAVA